MSRDTSKETRVHKIDDWTVKHHGLTPGAIVSGIFHLNRGSVEGVFRVKGGPVLITQLFCQVTEAVADSAINLSFKFDPDLGIDTDIAGAVSAQAAAIGDIFWAELDGTTLVKAAAGTALPIITSTQKGLIVPEGRINFILSAVVATGKCKAWCTYIPLEFNACLSCQDMQSSTTSTTTTSSSSSTSSTASSSSTTSSTTSTMTTATGG